MIACDLADEITKTEEEAFEIIDPRNLDTLLHPQTDVDALKKATPNCKGLGASPGAAFGQIVFTAEDTIIQKENGKKVILIRFETSPEYFTGIKALQTILTVRGGMTSHSNIIMAFNIIIMC